VSLIVQDNAQEGNVDVEPATVLNEAQLLEFIHEQINPGASCPDHFSKRLLRSFGKYFLSLVLLAIASEQKKSTRKAFLAGVKELVYKVLLDSNVSR
jgi:hypothetical protein